jgi:hypothetical protein
MQDRHGPRAADGPPAAGTHWMRFWTSGCAPTWHSRGVVLGFVVVALAGCSDPRGSEEPTPRGSAQSASGAETSPPDAGIIVEPARLGELGVHVRAEDVGSSFRKWRSETDARVTVGTVWAVRIGLDVVRVTERRPDGLFTVDDVAMIPYDAFVEGGRVSDADGSPRVRCRALAPDDPRAVAALARLRALRLIERGAR